MNQPLYLLTKALISGAVIVLLCALTLRLLQAARIQR